MRYTHLIMEVKDSAVQEERCSDGMSTPSTSVMQRSQPILCTNWEYEEEVNRVRYLVIDHSARQLPPHIYTLDFHE